MPAGALLQMVTTRDISRHGARLEGIEREFTPGEIISLSYRNNKARFQVSWMGDARTNRAGEMGVQIIAPCEVHLGCRNFTPGNDRYVCC